MNFSYYEFDVGPDRVIDVSVDKPVNVFLVDRSNFHRFKNGKDFEYYGGQAKRTRVPLRPPRRDHWFVVIDPSPINGTVRHSARVI